MLQSLYGQKYIRDAIDGDVDLKFNAKRHVSEVVSFSLIFSLTHSTISARSPFPRYVNDVTNAIANIRPGNERL